MSMNLPPVGYQQQSYPAYQPQQPQKPARFVKEVEYAGTDRGYMPNSSYVNINDIANLRKIGETWEADSLSHQTNTDGSKRAYHFDDNGAKQILSYLA